MKRLPNGSFGFSPTDLITFLEGDFAAWMSRARAGHQGDTPFPWQPDEDDAEAELVKAKGLEHEAVVLETLRTRFGSATEITGDDAAARTLEAMKAGAPLIYQGRLDAGAWHGYPDFLIKGPAPSSLGDWSYHPVDSKLARSAKPYFLIQLCAYARYLEGIQGVPPAKLGFVFGNKTEQDFDTHRYFYFYRHLEETFLAFQQAFDPSAPPDPGLERSWGNWSRTAERMLEERDDLRLVARISRSQVKRLRDAGISTSAALIASSGRIPRVSDDIAERLRRQARLQAASRDRKLPAFEALLPPAGTRLGLAMLPPPSPGDVFFDLEGNPLADDGLEYLWGAVTEEQGKPVFQDWWAHDEPAEKLAFEQVVDWFTERLRLHPGMHVYHYANYEVAALRRLMSKYGTREDEVDNLLRRNVFVDLYAVTRNGVAVGTRGYSLKDIEVLFSPPRTSKVMDASSSVAEYHRWLGSGESPRWQESPILADIRKYNEEDCENTWHLARWLRKRQAEAGVAYVAPEAKPEVEEVEEAGELVSRLLELAKREPEDVAAVTRLVGWLCDFHRREDKPAWWAFFDRKDSSAEELFDDGACLAKVHRTSTPPVADKRSKVVEYAFDPEQDTKLEGGDSVYLLFEGQAQQNKLLTLDADAGRLTIKFGPSKQIPDECHVIPDEIVNAAALRAAVERFAVPWADEQRSGYHAVQDMLFRRVPRLTGRPPGDLLPAQPRLPGDLVRLVQSLDQTTLCVQGPPGAGKTVSAAAIIVALAAAGKRVGVASNGHKAIDNLLKAVWREASSQRIDVRIIKAGGDDEPGDLPDSVQRCETKDVAGLLPPSAAGVVGGTAWLFARPELDQRFDYLFIDEAGQVSLANAVAMGLAAKNIVLIGDQRQLAQPSQAVHPEKSGLSCLHYLLEGYATVPPDRGVLLPTTWRLHPDVCRFISDTAYDGRLAPDECTARRCVHLPPDAKVLTCGTGIALHEVDHDGNTQSSEEEAERIATIVADLKRSTVQDEDGTTRPFDVARDLLIVAPYNAQVRCLKDRLADPAIRIASVDKFQGQEATVVIVSMSASSLDESPRGPAFLLNPNRLNVALSRARCLAVVVASSRLVRTRPSSVAEIELLNLYCRLRFYALGDS